MRGTSLASQMSHVCTSSVYDDSGGDTSKNSRFCAMTWLCRSDARFSSAAENGISVDFFFLFAIYTTTAVGSESALGSSPLTWVSSSSCDSAAICWL